ncbi:uncharacterized protein si:ch73-127m5.2 [Thalassophryne amazonica]|uniref:uncharacterized protein si:ch73-127m5.2 n=1 Tax=Thalassophryne amazonica TaxID=390379 RepID=UPI0014723E48|nr:uncharacterized protein si:ch73-127m5.2 [Thalassophryne amazonica]
MQVSAPLPTEEMSQNEDPSSNPYQNSGGPRHRCHLQRCRSLLDPNMKGSKARKYFISYEEIKRRLQAPEEDVTALFGGLSPRVSRGPASKKSLLESLNVLGLTPSTTTSVSSSFSKLTEGDTQALCDDMKDFAHDYINYGNMAKQLIPETNTVQHWSKIIETKNHLEDMRKCFKDPINSGAFDSVTHGLGLGMLDIGLDMIITVIEQQIRVLSGATASDPPDSGLPQRRNRRRNRKPHSSDNEKLHKGSEGDKEHGRLMTKPKVHGRGRKKMRLETETTGPVETQAGNSKPDNAENNVLTLVSVGYETVSSGLSTSGTV